MKVAVAMTDDGDDVLMVVGRDKLDAVSALSLVLGPSAMGKQIKVSELKVGRVYRNLDEEVRVHGN